MPCRIAVIDAGGGISSVVGGPFADNGHADARVSVPAGMVVASDGSVFVADEANNDVYKVAPDGAFVAVAGTGEKGFLGDGGSATQARLDGPTGVAVGSDGTIYVADSGNLRVRRVDASGVISTVALLQERPTGLLVLGDDSVLVSTALSGLVTQISADGQQSNLEMGVQGPDGTTPRMSLLAESVDGRVVLFANGQLILATLGASPLSVERYTLVDPAHPEQLVTGISSGAFDPAGSLWLCDGPNRRILRVDIL